MMEDRDILQVTNEHQCNCVITEKPTHCCISGTVADCCDVPIEGVCVKIITSKYEPVAHTLSNVQGNFTLIWKTDEDVQFIFAKAGYATLQQISFKDAQKVCLKKEIISCMISGKIFYKNCAPAASAKVQLVNNHVNLCTFSRADGSFLLTKVPGGNYTLTIEGNDCKQNSRYVSVPENCFSYRIGTIWVEQINILCTVHGIITDSSGQPIQKAVVVLISCTTKEPIAHTLSNENGLYFFGNVRNGCYYVEAFS